MLCDRVLGNVFEDPPRFDRRRRDPIELTWRDCSRRAVRAASAAGVRVGIVPPVGVRVRHGDVLFDDGAVIGVVSLTPCEVLVAAFADAASLARAALELGNLHVPVEVADAALITPPGGQAVGVFERYASGVRPEVRRFSPLRATVLGGGGVELAAGFGVRRASTDEQPRVEPVVRGL